MNEKYIFFFDLKEFKNILINANNIEPNWRSYEEILPIVSQIKQKGFSIDRIPKLEHTAPFEHVVAYHRFLWLRIWFMNRLSSREYDRKDAEKVLKIIKSWLKHYYKPKHPEWESYSVSERIISWLWCLMWLRALDAISFADRKLLEAAIKAHLSYLENHLEYHGERTNNHIIKDAQGLLYGGCYFFDDKNADRWRGIAEDILFTELDREFSKEFVHLEQTSHYHCLITKRYLECFLLAYRAKLEWADRLLSPMKKMMEVAYDLTFPDSTIPLFSDVSPDEPPSQVPNTILNMGGYIFKDKKFFRKSTGLNLEAFWFLGVRINNVIKESEEREFKKRSPGLAT
jgi:hypothetical protein